MTAAVVTTTCSGCTEQVRVNTATLSVEATRAGNGKRGSLRTAPEPVRVDAFEDDTTGLIMWDCPLCGHADSLDTSAEG